MTGLPPDPDPLPDVSKERDHFQHCQALVTAVLQDLSGEEISPAESTTRFLEMGFDSLFLSQVSQRLLSGFGLRITFRQLLGEVSSIAALAARLAQHLPAADPEQVAAKTPAAASPGPGHSADPVLPTGAQPIVVAELLRDQLLAMSRLIDGQLETLRCLGAGAPQAPVEAHHSIPAVTPLHPALASDKVRGLARLQVEGAPKTSAGTGAVTTEQRLHIDSLVARYTARTAGSKRDTQANRPVLADPRAAAGFRSEWKEMVYPIVCVRSAGSHIWDVDGNAYIDLVNGFGQTAFGHAPPFVVAAIKQQLDLGFAIGPQTPLAGQVARLFTELTGNERVTFCNTGSEAVMAALRVARSVTGRSGVVVFSGSYHGQFDEVLVKGLKRADRIGQSGPVATGIPASAVQNMTVLEYGAAESLEWIRQHAGELAAVVVEPVQSRHPDFLPIDFLRELRRITETSGTAFVMDEVVTGFRVHPGGMQAVTELRADLATYGKVVGGGLPIGVLAGTSRFMDALDGGMWQYGDDSVPEVGVTFFAGTFVRHPLAMAAAWAVLSHLKEHGVALQHELAGRTAGLVRILKDLFRQHGFVATIESYSSFFYFNIQNEHPLSSLLYYHLRLRGIHIHEGFPCFLTTAHTDDDLQAVADAFRDSLAELRSVGVPAPSQEQTSPTRIEAAALDPVARLRAPLTESQIEIWLSAQMSDAASCAFNESVSLKLSGELNRAALLGAMNELVARHDALRATFDASGEEIHFSATAAFSYPTVDLTGTTAEDAAVRLESLLNLDARTPFDLVNGPLLRAQLLVLSPTDHVFLITAHHIILDGWSMNLILGELAGLYSALCLRERAELGIPASFSEYAQSQWANPAVRIKAERYWMELFDAPVLPLELPTDRMRPALKSFRGATRRGTIDRNLYLALKHAGARQGCTLFVTLLGAFQALMGRLADQSEVVVGIPTAGQALLDNQILVGHCVNFLPLRSSWNAGTSLAAHLAATAASVVDAQEHQDYTLATLVRKLALAREPGRTPLADVQFNLEKLAGHLVVPRLQIAVTPNPKACVTFDLFMNVIESDEGLRIDCDYNTDLFDEMTIDRWIESYRALLEAIVADTTQLLIEAPLMTAMNLQRILVDFNNTEAPYPRDRCMHTLFESQVAARPEATAASFAETSLTYSALDRRANQLANHLRTRLAVADGANGSLIAISVRRSLDMLVALLATLKAGFAYVPLDPSHPVVRQRHILADASVAAMITDHHSDLDILFDADALIHLHDDADAIGQASAQSPAQATVADDLAYVIYTSGSTGLPKGVEVSHRSLVNLLGAMASRPGIQAEDVLLAATTISFDIAALELFLPLIVGARVVIAAQEDVNDGFRLRQLIDDGGVNSMQATPSGWRLLLDAGFRSSPGFKMLCGGEALTRPLADRLLQGGGDLWNLYGPTETTIWSSCARIAQHSPDITAGRPVSNTQLYVLDRNNQPTPCGVPGQLHIGGDGVARRYHGKPALTAEQFVPNPFGPGRVYRTGDLARWSADGEIQILGRIDQQIKLHGYRIEPGEIEAALTKRAGLHSVVVLHKDPGGPQRLACYFVDNSGNRRSSTELCELLAEELPEYMVPTVWVRLDSLPLSPNGKLDRGALPSSELSQSNQAEYVAPATPLELLLAQIWGDVLSRKQIGTRDDLFDLGADSIHIFQITARANRQGIHVSAKQLIRHRNIYDLAKELEDLGASKAVSSALLQFDERDIPDTVTQAAG